MERNCDHCGRVYEAKSTRSKFCADVECKRGRERARNRRRTSGATADVVPIVLPTAPDADRGPLEQATFDQLVAAGREATAAGLNVLVLARRLDAGSRETGQALTALAKQHLAGLDKALEGAAVAGDAIDELRARREAKRVSNG